MPSTTESQMPALEERVLDFAARHRAFLAAHVQTLIEEEYDGDAEPILVELEAAGLLRGHRHSPGAPSAFRITTVGLRRIGSELPAPTVSGWLKHDLGVVWLWLAARSGRLGEVGRLLTEREMRAADDARAATGRPATSPAGAEAGMYGVAVGAAPGQRSPCLYYPDLVLITGDRRVPIHVVLSPPASSGLESQLVAYGADERVSRVIFAVTQATSAGMVMLAATKRDLLGLVDVYPVSFEADLVSAAGR